MKFYSAIATIVFFAFVPSTDAATNPLSLRIKLQPSNVAVGGPVLFQVETVDAQGALVTTPTQVDVAFRTNPSGATLSGTLSLVTTGGVASFPDLSVDKAGTYTLVASVQAIPSLTTPTVTSQPFNVGTPPPSATPPTSYAAVSHTNPIPEPALPVMGPAGFRFNDPAFGSRMVRATDGTTGSPRGAAYVDRRYVTSESSEASIFNADSTRFYVGGSGGERIAMDFDPVTMQVSPDADVYNGGSWLPFGGEFSYQDPDLYFGMAGGTFKKYRLASGGGGTITDIHTMGSGITPDPSGSVSSFSVANQAEAGVTMAAAVDAGPPYNQNQWDVVYVYREGMGGRWWDVANGTIGGDWGPSSANVVGAPTGHIIHNIRIGKDGRYVAVTLHAGGPPTWVWDLETTQVINMSVQGQGHRIIGHGKAINQHGASDVTGSWEPFVWRIRGVGSQAELDAPVSLILNPPAGNAGGDSHLSWNNSRAGVSTPVCMSTYTRFGVPPQRAWQEEILAVSTAAPGQTQTVWRFAHHRSTYHGFWSSPRGNVSPDGRFYAFSSNWEDSMGQDRYGDPRIDVFVVELK